MVGTLGTEIVGTRRVCVGRGVKQPATTKYMAGSQGW